MSGTRPQHPPASDGLALRRVLRSVTQMDGLLMLLAVLYYLVARDRISHALPFVGAICVYGACVFALYSLPTRLIRPHARLLVAAAAMVAFITSLLALSGAVATSLSNLYLLPIVMSALTLGRTATLLVMALVLVARIALGHFVAADDVFTLGYGLGLVAEAAPVLLVALLTSMLAGDLRAVNERLQVLADSDDVTGLLNLQAFTRLVAEERERALRAGRGFALLLVDVGELKAVNDRHGPEAGNRMLAAVAQALRRSSRAADLVARYGGDEFLMFLSGAGAEGAAVVASRIRHNVGTTTLELDGKLARMSVRIGVAIFPGDGRELRELINAASRAVDKDKASRRPLGAAPAER